MYCRESYLKKLNLKNENLSLQFLNELISSHLAHFSFNNLSVYYSPGEILNLEENFLFQKVVEKKLGGYCFELNKLFFYLLNDFGFTVKSKMARVNYNKEGQFPRTHRISIVDIDGRKYLSDVGFGPYTPSLAIPLNGEEVNCFGRTYRVVKGEAGLQLEVIKDSSFFCLYQFDDAQVNEADFNVANYYTNTHPDSKFVKEVVVSRIKENLVEFITNKIFVTMNLETGTRQEEAIQTQSDYELLLRKFQITGNYDFGKINT